MIQFSINHESALTGIDLIIKSIAELEFRVFNLRPLADEIVEVIEVDNIEARLAGVGWDDTELAPLKDSTWKRHPDRGPGPPLAGHGTESRATSDLTFEMEDVGPGEIDIIGSWPNMPFLYCHVTGTQFMEARDIVGISENARHGMKEVFERVVPEMILEQHTSSP